VQNYFRDSHDGDVLGADDPLLAQGLHADAAEAEELGGRLASSQFGNQLRAILVAAGLSGRKKNNRVGVDCDAISVDFSRGVCMAGKSAKSFRAMLEPLRGGLGWIVARVPFDVEAAWTNMVRLRVTVEVGGTIFRTSLFSEPVRGGHFILVNKNMQKSAGAKVGAIVNFTIAPDLEERTPTIQPELAKVLKGEKALTKYFVDLSDPIRYQISRWIDGVKSPEARERRAEQIAEQLLLTMEGEKVLPPILDVAFHETPAARRGWQAMTLVQRRGHLMGVFYYRSPEARLKRVQKVVEDAVRVANG
jgi:hypothetical protein